MRWSKRLTSHSTLPRRRPGSRPARCACGRTACRRRSAAKQAPRRCSCVSRLERQAVIRQPGRPDGLAGGGVQAQGVQVAAVGQGVFRLRDVGRRPRQSAGGNVALATSARVGVDRVVREVGGLVPGLNRPKAYTRPSRPRPARPRRSRRGLPRTGGFSFWPGRRQPLPSTHRSGWARVVAASRRPGQAANRPREQQRLARNAGGGHVYSSLVGLNPVIIRPVPPCPVVGVERRRRQARLVHEVGLAVLCQREADAGRARRPDPPARPRCPSSMRRPGGDVLSVRRRRSRIQSAPCRCAISARRRGRRTARTVLPSTFIDLYSGPE